MLKRLKLLSLKIWSFDSKKTTFNLKALLHKKKDRSMLLLTYTGIYIIE